MLRLGQVARSRKRLDDATIAALLDAVAQAPQSSALYAIESLPALGGPARSRLVEVAGKALEHPGPNRSFALRALAKGGAEAAPLLRHLLDAEATTDAERADAARSLGALGGAAQTDLTAVLAARARKLLDEKAWLTSQHGVVLTLLEGLDSKPDDAPIVKELAQLPLDGDAPTKRRKIMLRCRAAVALAGKASASRALLDCDPSAPAERREGALALLKVLGRGPLDQARGVRFAELARSSDRVVREAALELLMAHDEVANIPALLADALATNEVGVQATAAKILARYPSRAAPAGKEDAKGEKPAAAGVDPRVVQALTKALAEVGKSNNIEVASGLLDAAAALELLGARPALERACASTNPTLRQHAERGFAALGEPAHRCASVAGTESWTAPPAADFKLSFDTDVGPLSITLWGNKSPFATLRLVELARSGFFNGMLIHRVVPGFVVQLGDPDGDGFGGPPSLPPLRCQLGPEDFDLGSVGVALAGRDTGSSQFFVTFHRAPHLVGEYSLIGHAEPGWERLAAGDRILSASVLEVASVLEAAGALEAGPN
jgi:cyclophilin family peptidyl-prolyl cis-trans isomerase